MTEGEKPSLSKFVGSFFQAVPWLKDIRTIASIVIIAFVGFTIYRAYFMKTTTQKNTQRVTYTIHADPGSNINVEAPKQEAKQENPKGHWSAGPVVLYDNHNNDFMFGGVVLYNF